MVLRQSSYLRAVILASLTLVSVMLAPPQIQAQRKDDVYSRRYISEIMSKVYDWQIRNPVEINERNNNFVGAGRVLHRHHGRVFHHEGQEVFGAGGEMG